MMQTGYITGITPGKGIHVYIPYPDTDSISRKHITQVTADIRDGRTITPSQRRKIFALIRDITEYISAPDGAKRTRAEAETLRQMGLLYLIDYADSEAVRYQLEQHYCQLLNLELFSLSSVDKATAGDFIDWLVELCVIHGIPCIDTLLNRCEDIERYLYACVANRRCAVCGKRADIHEVDKVQAGRNRQAIHHLGQRVQPLCRLHHTQAESMGQQTFDKTYCMESIRLDGNLCEILKWKK